MGLRETRFNSVAVIADLGEKSVSKVLSFAGVMDSLYISIEVPNIWRAEVFRGLVVVLQGEGTPVGVIVKPDFMPFLAD